MNYGSQVAGAVKIDQSPDPLGPVIVKTLDRNIERMHSNISRIEDQLHNILNLRNPPSETAKTGVPMENDLASAINNRVNSLDIFNDRLETIITHLNRIVG